MKRSGLRFLCCAGVALFLLGGVSASAAANAVTDVRVGVTAEKTRIVFEIAEPISFRMFTLDAPYRVVIDMPKVDWRPASETLPRARGVLSTLRHGLYRKDSTRVVIDLSGPARIENVTLMEPDGVYRHRLVLDLASTDRATFLAQKNAGPITLKTAGSVKVALTPHAQASDPPVIDARFPTPPHKPALRPGTDRYTVIIDPGHGGPDPGAISRSGYYEKHITLSAAHAIRDALEKTGRFRVILTRDRDVYIKLRKRIRIARDAGADLFISIHADTVKNKKTRGPSVYTLSERASDREAANLAEKENKSDLIAGIDLTHESRDVADILIDLAQRESMNQSARFAGFLIGELRRQTRVLRNTHRFAGFAVLRAPDVPSVLLELGFLSNASDEKNLRSKTYRKRLATGIARAVSSYFVRIEQAERL